MKRNRFSEMIPPVPADFHGAVVDALNRVEAAERGHRAYMARMSAYAAAAAALVLVVCLAVMMPKRLPKEDVVTAPNESEMIVRPTEEPEQVRMEIGEWQVADDGSLTLEWTMTATEEESLVFCGDARPVFENGVQLDGFELFMLTGNGVGTTHYMQIGRDLRGDGNGTHLQYTGRSGWSDKTPVALAIHVDVYHPTAQLVQDIELGTESFQNTPAWWVNGTSGDRFAIPIDWYDHTRANKTYFGSELLMDALSEFGEVRMGRKLTTAEEALKFLQEEGALRTALLEGYDFGEHVRSFDFIVDLTARSGVGAELIEE